MEKSILIVALFIITLTSCQNNSNPVNQSDTVVQDTLSRHEQAHALQKNPIVLNNGEKWTANSETSEGIRKMTVLISTFSSRPKRDDYRSLKVQLETEFNLILQKCTMTGEAHSQLHNYLMPMTEMFEHLNSDDMEICSKTLDELKKHLNEYENYFL